MTLDIDRDAINKKLRIMPDENEEHNIPWLSKDVRKELSKPTKRIEPFPGICVKVWDESGEKIFINICHSKEICAPEDISDEKLYQITMADDACGYVVPMALGIEKMAKDKEDVERPTFDILINTSYFEKILKKKHFWQFTIQAIMESLNDKYKKSINFSKHVMLKNRKVMGSLDTFNIEDRGPKKPVPKKQLIQLLDSQEIDNSKLKPKKVEMKSNECNVSDEPDANQNYVILKSADGINLIGFFYLPSSSIADITLDVGESRIIVENQKAGSIIDAFLPYRIDNSLVTSSYDSKLHILRLVLPLKKD